MIGTRGTMRGRGLFALVALLFALGEILGLAHLSAQRHEVCREHGELVHVDEHRPARHGAPDGRLEGSESAPDSEVPPERAPEHDEGSHCRICASLASPTVLADSAAIVPTASPLVVDHTPVVQARPLARRRYVVAPQTSPPLA